MKRKRSRRERVCGGGPAVRRVAKCGGRGSSNKNKYRPLFESLNSFFFAFRFSLSFLFSFSNCVYNVAEHVEGIHVVWRAHALTHTSQVSVCLPSTSRPFSLHIIFLVASSHALSFFCRRRRIFGVLSRDSSGRISIKE